MLRILVSTSLALLVALTAAAEERPLSVITYNVQFLPGMASAFNDRPEPEYRAKRIAEEVAAFDIVGLQEMFHVIHRGWLLDALQEKWEGGGNVVIAPKPEGFYGNGGTLLATRMPIVEEDAMVFKHFSKPEDHGTRADGYAAKGVIFGRVAMSDGPDAPHIDVYVTHLEARQDDLRPLQYKEWADFVKKTTDPNAPALFLGDFNTKGSQPFRDDPDSQYSQMMAALNAARPNAPVVDVWLELRPDEFGGTSDQDSTETGKRIDYILMSNPSDGASRLVPEDIEVRLYQDEKVTALSDHNAVAANFTWKTTE